MDVVQVQRSSGNYAAVVKGVDTHAHIEHALLLWWFSDVNGMCFGDFKNAVILPVKDVKQAPCRTDFINTDVSEFNCIDHPYFLFYYYDQDARELHILGACNHEEIQANSMAVGTIPVHKHIVEKTEEYPLIQPDQNHWPYFYTSTANSNDTCSREACEKRIRALCNIMDVMEASGTVGVTKYLQDFHDTFFELHTDEGRRDDIGSHLMCLLLTAETPEFRRVVEVGERELFRFRMTQLYADEHNTIRVMRCNLIDIEKYKTCIDGKWHAVTESLFRSKYARARLPLHWFEVPFENVCDFLASRGAQHVIISRGNAYLSYKDVWRWLWCIMERHVKKRMDLVSSDAYRAQLRQHLSQNTDMASVYMSCKTAYETHIASKSTGGHHRGPDKPLPPVESLVDIEDLASSYLPPCMGNLMTKALSGKHLKFEERQTFFPFIRTVGYSLEQATRCMEVMWSCDKEYAGNSAASFQDEYGGDFNDIYKKKVVCRNCDTMINKARQGASSSEEVGCPLVRYANNRTRLEKLFKDLGLEDVGDIESIHESVRDGAYKAACAKYLNARRVVRRATPVIKNPQQFFHKARYNAKKK